MFSIGRFATLAKVSARTVRHYEATGLLKSSGRGLNNYRQFDSEQLERMKRIRDLKELGFSLKEIQKILAVSSDEMIASLQSRLRQVNGEIASLQLRKSELERLLSISTKIGANAPINDIERKHYMFAVREEILKGLETKSGKVSPLQLSYVERDEEFYSDPDKKEFLSAIKRCVEFAKARGFTLGPGRGSSPASIALYALGFNSFDPSKYGLIPERLSTPWMMDVHIDVEFERGQEFVDFCRETTRQLRFGQINAFKMPLLDILKSVHQKIGSVPDYASIDENSDIILRHFRTGRIEKIFGFDNSPEALVMKYENILPEYLGTEKISEYLKSQPIVNFRDVINISALWRPSHPELLKRIENYKLAKQSPQSIQFLETSLQKSLVANFGQVIYHEDLLRILHHYTSWSLAKCNQVRRRKLIGIQTVDSEKDLAELEKTVPKKVYDLITKESSWTFCQPHAIAFSFFTKQTAVLKTLHPDIYLNEIKQWEQDNGFAWDDIGIKLNGVSLFQS
jgi:DNA-binding transcriptional MerR regulator